MTSMPKQEGEKPRLTLTVILPDRPSVKTECDRVTLTVKDNTKGKNGGSYGIRPGHVPSVFLLDPGRTEAFLEGKTVWKGITSEGFAKVENNAVTVVTEAVTVPEAEQTDAASGKK